MTLKFLLQFIEPMGLPKLSLMTLIGVLLRPSPVELRLLTPGFAGASFRFRHFRVLRIVTLK